MIDIHRRQWLAITASTAVANHVSAAIADPPITSLAFSRDGEFVLAGSQRGVSIRDAKTLIEADHLRPSMDNVHDIRFSQSGTVLMIAGGNPGEGGVVEMLDWPSLKRQHRLLCHSDVIDSVDFSQDDHHWVAASSDEVCSVYAMESPDPKSRFTKHSKAVRSARFLPDGETIVSASRDETLRVWNVATGESIRTLHNHSRDVNALALKPSAEGELPMIASASADLTIRFWQPTIGRMVRFARLKSEPLCIAWTTDGKNLIAGCRDGFARIIDPINVKVTDETRVAPDWLYAVAVDPTSDNRAVFGTAGGKVLQG